MHRIRFTRRWYTGLTACAMVALSAAAALAAIGPLVTIGGFFQQSSNTTSVSPPTAGDCNPSSLCYFVFGKAPAGKQLLVTHVSCTVFLSTGELHSAILRIQRGNGSYVDSVQYLVPVKTADTRYTISGSTLALYDQNQRPILEVQGTANAQIFGTCAVSGQIIDAPS